MVMQFLTQSDLGCLQLVNLDVQPQFVVPRVVPRPWLLRLLHVISRGFLLIFCPSSNFLATLFSFYLLIIILLICLNHINFVKHILSLIGETPPILWIISFLIFVFACMVAHPLLHYWASLLYPFAIF